MEQSNKTPLATIQAEIRQKKINRKRRKIRRWIKIIGVLFLLFFVIFMIIRFEQSSSSKVNDIIVKNNHYVSEYDILNQASLKKGQRIYTKIGPFIETSLKKHPFIEEADVSINYMSQQITIYIKESRFIGYVIEEETKLVSETANLLAIDDLILIADLPLIRGYHQDDLAMVVKYLNRIDRSIYGSISEMSRNPVSYDETQISLTMADGITITSPLSGLELLTSDYYYDVINRLNPNNRCLLIDPFTKSMVSSVCETINPEDEQVTEP